MPRDASGAPPQHGRFLDDVRADLPWREWAFPGILAILLSIPCIGFAYMLDDYVFLNNALRSRVWDLLPDPLDAFYRPLSRGLYFYVLLIFRDYGALLGHVINIVTLGLIASLVGAVGARLGGRRVGLLSGTVFAGLSSAPILIAWTCCSQDLLAMLFVLLAVHFKLSGRPWATMGCVALGIISKETTIATIPAILALDWIRRRPMRHVPRELAGYTMLIAAWATVHPAMGILIRRGFRPGRTGYVGLPGFVESIKHVGLYVWELTNTRVGKLDWTWSPWEATLLVASAAAGVITVRHFIRVNERGRGNGTNRAALLFGILLGAGPLMLTSVMILGMSQYYAVFPGLGASLVLGTWLAGRSRPFIVAAVAAFLVFGLWSRCTSAKEQILTESDFRVSSAGHHKLKKSMLRLQPTMPRESQILMSVQARGRVRVYYHIYNYQTPCLWYWDPSLVTRKPENRQAGTGPEFLFAVSRDLDVVRIDPLTFQTVSSSGRPADYLTVEQALRTYAMGLAGSGETDAAARLLVEMPEVDASFESFHHRMAVMFLLADGREEDARRLEAGIPPATRAWALDNLPAILAQQPSSRNFDAVGLRAFGIDSTDADALRHPTRWYLNGRYAYAGGRFADRLLRLAPADSVAMAARWVRDSTVAVLAKARIREE